MTVPRREFLTAAALAPWLSRGDVQERAPKRGGLGLVIHSFAVRGRDPAFAEPLRFLETCRGLGVDAIQVGLGVREDVDTDELRTRAETAGMALEGIVALPRDEADTQRFEAEIATAVRAGADIVRTVCLSGRRYETFATRAAFRHFRDEARARLEWAAPIVARHHVRLAVENHKDFRADELLELIRGLPDEHVGVCLDTGNSIALLEEPHEVVEALAPRAFTTHFKDMAAEESPDGFRLAEVPLGEGTLDLPRMVRTIRSANPTIRFHVEMITRDPLVVPCVSDRFWATFPELPGLNLARTLRAIRSQPHRQPLPIISEMPPEAQRRAEDDHNRRSLRFARERLRL